MGEKARIVGFLLCWFVWGIFSVVLAAPENGRLTQEEIAEGWLSLFDGETLFGWQFDEGANWEVVDGAIRASEGPEGLLWTRTEFADFHLKLEFRAGPETNSGVFLRTVPRPDNPGAGGDCYELNIAPPDNPFPTGSLVQRQRYDGGAADDWRSFDVIATGDRLIIQLDGREVMDYQESGTPVLRGHIGLQYREGPIEFRNIRIKPLGLQPIFDRQTLSGWQIYPDRDSVFQVTTEGDLNILNGPGQLESEGQFQDFVLRVRVQCRGEGLNSGIFFRSIPREFWQGYESQIHNGYKNGDRCQPEDFGTGGIYRRQPARKVVANDNEWFYKTLIVTGPHMAVWVNGFPVTSWTDERSPHSNPREGKRLEGGTIILQGHDPTTDLLFAQIEAVEYPH